MTKLFLYILVDLFRLNKLKWNRQLFLFTASIKTGLLICSKFLYKNIKVWTFLNWLRHISVMNVSLVTNFCDKFCFWYRSITRIITISGCVVWKSSSSYSHFVESAQISDWLLTFCSFVAHIISTNNWNNCVFGLSMSFENLLSVYSYFVEYVQTSDQLVTTRFFIDRICFI